MGIKNLIKQQRPREKALLTGLDQLSDIELIAILIGYGNKNKDVFDISYGLIKKYGSLSEIFKLSLDELMSNDGIKLAKAIKIAAINEIYLRVKKQEALAKETISLIGAGNIFKSLICEKKEEHLALIMLDKNQKLLYAEVVASGGESSVSLYPKKIMEECLFHHAKKLYIAHNHPSDNLSPSRGDLEETKNIQVILGMINVTLIDHLIIGKNSFFSLSLNKEIKYQENNLF